MALIIEMIDAEGVVTEQPLGPETVRIAAEPGNTYRVLHQNGSAVGTGPRVVRIGDDLVVTDLPDGETVELSGFFSACTPEQSCALSLEELGGERGDVITPTSEPVAALKDGGFLMNHLGNVAEPSAPGSEIRWKPIAAIGGGLALVGGLAGGGGGDEASDETAPSAPTLNTLTTNDTTPVIEGTAEAGSTVRITIDVGGTGTQNVTYQTQADSNGNWSIDTGSDSPTSGSLPSTGLPTDAPSTINLLATDAAGNDSNVAQNAITIDITPPSALATVTTISDNNTPITGDLAPNADTNDVSPTISGTLSEALASGDSVHVFRDGTLLTGTVTVTGTSWTYADSAVSEGSHTWTASVRDAAGNSSALSASLGATVDTEAPAIPTIANIDGDNLIDRAQALANITVSGTAEANTAVNLTWSGLSRVVAVDGSGNWTTIVQTADLPADGPSSVSATSTDAAGNVSAAASLAVTIDQSLPGLAITSSAAGVSNAPVTLTFTFDEAVSGFSLADISTSAGTLGNFNSVSDTVYTAALTPAANSNVTANINVSSGAAQDSVGNLSGAGSTTQTFDTLAPTVVITDDVAAASADGPVTFTFTFSEVVTDFVIGDIAVAGGNPGVLSGSGTTYQLVVTPPVATAGTLSVSLAQDAATDAAGNGIAATNAAQAFDTTAPTLVITDNTAATTTNGNVIYTFTFSQAVTGFSAGDISVTQGSKVTFNSVSSTVYTLEVAPTPDATGSIGVSVGAGVATGTAGGNLAAAAAPQAFDTESPTLVISDDVAGSATGDITYTFNFGEEVSGFTAANITVNASVGTHSTGILTTADQQTYTLVVSPPDDLQGTMSVSVNTSGVTDDVGNTSDAAPAVPNQAFDLREPPVAVITSDVVGNDPVNSTVTYTFTFNEPVSIFNNLDVTVTGGGEGSVTGSGAVYQMISVLPSDSTGNIVVTLAAGGASDAAGNDMLGSVSTPIAFDTESPTLVITDNEPASDAAGDVTFTFDFGEVVTGFDIGDITITGGAAGVLSGSGQTYTLTVTPPGASTGVLSVSVGADAAIDVAGNGNSSANHVQNYDTSGGAQQNIDPFDLLQGGGTGLI